MKAYLFIALFALALVPVLATQALAENCTVTCSSLGYNCGYWTLCGATVNCGNCGEGLSCDTGVCQDSCASHDEKRCYSGDVYWYDSCGHREGKYESCDVDCRNGRCVYDKYNDNEYYNDYNYYNSRYYRCQPFCNYPSLCSQSANDGCGNICHRITDGIACGSNGQCSNGACLYPPKPTPQQQVEVQGLPAYQVVAPAQITVYSQPAGISSDLVFILLILAIGCIFLLFMVFFIIMKLMR